MPAPTYFQIATTTVGAGGATTIDFNSIPQTYSDLVIKLSLRSNYATSGDLAPVFMRFNGSSASIYSGVELVFFQSSIATATNPYNITNSMFAGFANSTGPTANTFNSTDIYIPNYTGANFKSTSIDSAQSQNSTSNYTFATLIDAGLWSSTAAITSISLFCGTASNYNFTQYSTATLYGISNA